MSRYTENGQLHGSSEICSFGIPQSIVALNTHKHKCTYLCTCQHTLCTQEQNNQERQSKVSGPNAGGAAQMGPLENEQILHPCMPCLGCPEGQDAKAAVSSNLNAFNNQNVPRQISGVLPEPRKLLTVDPDWPGWSL
jgi:hypothetical protein